MHKSRHFVERTIRTGKQYIKEKKKKVTKRVLSRSLLQRNTSRSDVAGFNAIPLISLALISPFLVMDLPSFSHDLLRSSTHYWGFAQILTQQKV